MKIAITSKGKDLDSQIDPKFGRAPILILDTLHDGFDVLDNSENVNAFKGAGIQAAVIVVGDRGAKVLLTGYCGPNAFKTLNTAGVKVSNNVTGTVRDAVIAYRQGKVSFADGANLEGSW